ncbi:hypothetical protein ACFFON_10255 [Arthrobacter citreus]|uniref:hypothetical protein n=1 Tax=Arthrobacter TaxID=1663 RepID=UPI001264062E|nr:hypothetical protein [Arthrobacter gandavensis]
MKNWKAPSKILLLFGVCLAAFFVLRLFVPSEYALLVLGIPGAIFVSYMANLGVNMVRNPPPPPGKSDIKNKADPQ